MFCAGTSAVNAKECTENWSELAPALEEEGLTPVITAFANETQEVYVTLLDVGRGGWMQVVLARRPECHVLCCTGVNGQAVFLSAH